MQQHFNQLTERFWMVDDSSVGYLEDIVEQYPWFDLARFMLYRARGMGRIDVSTAARLVGRPYPRMMMTRCAPLEYAGGRQLNPIDAFLSMDLRRTQSAMTGDMARDEYSEYMQEDISIGSLVENDEVVSETLAQIYLMQGHKDRACEIYLKLSLIFPEKSSYFATLIDNIKNT